VFLEPTLEARWLGRVPYAEALELQSSLIAARRAEQVGDTLLLLEHPQVITLGRGSDPAHVLLSPEELARRGIELHEAGRGGDVTYHGPGQLVGYPVLALRESRRDAHRYLRDLEEVLIRSVAAFGIAAGRKPGLTGVWVGDEKVAAIGVRLSTGWITSHGFALNVEPDPEGFATIVPCGLANHGVTWMNRLLPSPVGTRQVAAHVAREFAGLFGHRLAAAAAVEERLGGPDDSGLSSSP
jgi:lipoyl(octanoyl) transferase